MYRLLRHILLPGAQTTALFLFVILLFSSAGAFAEDWIYTVQSGDNLWNLSKKYLISIRYREKLQALNQVPDPIHIPAGTKLRFPLKWLKSGSSIARISHVKGKVTMTAGETGRIHPVKKGMILWEKDTIRTGADSTVIFEFSDGSKIQLQSESRLLLEVMKSYGDTGMVDTRVKLLKGRTRNKVIPRSGPGSRFEIITPSAAAAVRGTEYRISALENNKSNAEVLRGEVGLKSKGSTRVLSVGFGSVAFADRPPLLPVELLTAPDVSELSSTLTQIPPSFTLKQQSGTTAYRLQVSSDSSFTAFLYNDISTSNDLTLPDLPDGSYYLRIRGIDKHGLEGFESIHPFTLAAHPIPPDLFLPAAGAITKTPQPTFQWSAIPEAKGYTFQLADNKKFANPITLSHYQKSSYTPNQPLKAGLYYWRTATLDSSGKQGPFSTPQSFRSPPSAPDLSLARFNDQDNSFSWGKTGQDEYYRIQVARDPSFTDIVKNEQVTESRYSLTDLAYGDYFVRVAVISTDGFQGSFSQSQQVNITAPFNAWVLSIIPLAALLIIL